MSKIETSSQDYTCHGLGCNGYNYCNNVIPKISNWLLSEYLSLRYSSVDEHRKFAKKLEKIVAVINEMEEKNE